MSLLSEFRDFAVKGNVVDLAVGVIIGGAFGKIVSSVVADVVWLWDDPECLPVSRRQLLHVRLAKGDADLAERLEAVFAKHPGTDEVVLHVVVGSREVVVHADRYHVLAGPALSAEIDELVGAAATRLETVRPKAQANGNGHGRSRR